MIHYVKINTSVEYTPTELYYSPKRIKLREYGSDKVKTRLTIN